MNSNGAIKYIPYCKVSNSDGSFRVVINDSTHSTCEFLLPELFSEGIDNPYEPPVKEDPSCPRHHSNIKVDKHVVQEVKDCKHIEYDCDDEPSPAFSNISLQNPNITFSHEYRLYVSIQFQKSFH
jgi:hypothetical protein